MEDAITKTYQLHEKLLHKLAHQFAFSQQQQEELFEEACICFCEIFPQYDAKKGAFSTFLTVCVNNHLKRHLAKNRGYTSYETTMDDDMWAYQQVYDTYSSMEDNESFVEMIASFTEDELHIYRLLISNECLYINDISPKKVRGLLTKLLREEKWAWSRIWATFTSIKQKVNKYECR